jgi:flagellar protein FliO/FliZ
MPLQKCKLSVLLFLFLIQCFHPAEIFAGTSPADDAADYFRVIWGLLVVLGIILILYGFLKKRFSLLSTNANQHIQIVELKPLMGKKALCLISVKGQEHLLGISGDNITHIAALTPQPESSFAEVLQSAGVKSRS